MFRVPLSFLRITQRSDKYLLGILADRNDNISRTVAESGFNGFNNNLPIKAYFEHLSINFRAVKISKSVDQLLLFTDGSVHAQSSIGFGAYLVVPHPGLPLESLRTQVKVKRFEDTTSSKLELQTLLWALGELDRQVKKVKVYTDSQTIIGLPGRRDRLERNDYFSARNILLKNAALYRAFFRITDQLDCAFEKGKGHRQASKKNEIEQLFTLVDRAARNALRGASARSPSTDRQA